MGREKYELKNDGQITVNFTAYASFESTISSGGRSVYIILIAMKTVLFPDVGQSLLPKCGILIGKTVYYADDIIYNIELNEYDIILSPWSDLGTIKIRGHRWCADGVGAYKAAADWAARHHADGFGVCARGAADTQRKQYAPLNQAAIDMNMSEKLNNQENSTD